MVAGHIVYVVQNAFSRRDHNRFGAGYWVSEGHSVTVIDAADLINPHISHDRRHYSEFSDIEVIVAADRRGLRKCLATVSTADLIISSAEGGHVTPRNLSALRLIAQSGRPWLVMATNAYPGWSRYKHEDRSPWRRLMDVAGRLGNIRPLFSLAARLPHSWLGVRKADFMVVAGSKGLRSTLAGPHTKTIAAHAMDYDLVLEQRRSLPPQENIAVYVDEGGPLHPDYSNRGETPVLSVEEFFGALRRLFDRIERETGLPMVVAACPRIDYAKYPGLFGDRRVEVGRTAELIARSRLVVGHRSTALSTAVLFRRPILITALRAHYEQVGQRPYIDGYARVLGKEIFFYDDPEAGSLGDLSAVDQEAYDRYIEAYVKPAGTPDLPYWRIVHQALAEHGLLASPNKAAA